MVEEGFIVRGLVLSEEGKKSCVVELVIERGHK